MLIKQIEITDLVKNRVNKWIAKTKPIKPNEAWTEKRLAIDIGGHTFIITNGQVFECAHCGRLDPEWKATEIVSFFRETLNIEPYEIEVICTVAPRKNNEI